MPLLELTDVTADYGAVRALHGVSLAVDEGTVVSVLGANGAGKTTTLRAVSGTVRTGGTIAYAGRTVGRSPEQAARAGIAHVPEGRGTFVELSVWENLRLGAYTSRKADFARVVAYFPWLEQRRNQQAGTLSGGEQQMLALARALMSAPKLLVLDEPSMGLAPMMVAKIFDIVAEIAKQGVTILLVEQNALAALELAARGYVMESGEISLAGDAKSLLSNPKVREAYLGEGA